MTGTNEFTTERLLLRRYSLDDAQILYDKFGRDPQMYKYSGWNPYATKEMSKETVQRFIDSYNKPYTSGTIFQQEIEILTGFAENPIILSARSGSHVISC